MTTTKILNPLPAPTWGYLGVNRAKTGLPETPASGWGDSGSRVGRIPRAVRVVCPGFRSLESGAGAEFDGFLREQAQLRLHLAADRAVDEPILLEHRLDGAHPNALTHVTVQARPGSRLTLIEVIRGGETGGVHGTLVEVCAGGGAEVTVIQLQMLGSAARSLSGLAAETEQGAKVSLFRAALGGKLSLGGSRCILRGSGSAFTARSIYYGDGESLVDLSDTAIHLGRDTRSEIHAAGVLDGAAEKTLRGTIDFHRGAVRAVGHESEDVLLLSPRVRNRTAPLILCGEEQVEGQHAASIGRLDENLLYYMASRGIGEAEAKRALALGKYAPVLDMLPPDLRCEAEGYLERRLIP